MRGMVQIADSHNFKASPLAAVLQSATSRKGDRGDDSQLFGKASDISVPAYDRGFQTLEEERQRRRLTLKATFQIG
jgi:hypothetical protein